jgi:outer membrane protein OmpA-like peptidoglycan-associated protein
VVRRAALAPAVSPGVDRHGEIERAARPRSRSDAAPAVDGPATEQPAGSTRNGAGTRRAPVALAPSQARALQRLAGNRAVSALVTAQRRPADPAFGDVPANEASAGLQAGSTVDAGAAAGTTADAVVAGGGPAGDSGTGAPAGDAAHSEAQTASAELHRLGASGLHEAMAPAVGAAQAAAASGATGAIEEAVGSGGRGLAQSAGTAAAEAAGEAAAGARELPEVPVAPSAEGGQEVEPTGAAAGGVDGLPVQRDAALAEPIAEIRPPELPNAEVEADSSHLATVSQEAQSEAGSVGSSAGRPSGGGLLGGLISRAVSWVGGKVSSVTGLLSGAGSTVLDVLRHPVDSLTAGVKATVTGARHAASAAIGAVGGGVRAALDGARGAIQGVVKGAFGAARTLLGRLGPMIGQAVRSAISGGKGLASSVIELVQQKAQQLFAGFTALPARIAAAATGAVTRLQTALTAITTRIAATVTELTTRIATTLDGAIQAAGAVVQNIVGRARSFLSGVPGIIASLVRPIVDRILAAVSRFVARIQAAIHRVIATVRAAITRAVAVVVGLVQRAVAAAADFIRNRIAAVRDLVVGAIQHAMDAARSAVAAVGNLIRTAMQRILAPIREWLITKITDWLAPRIKSALAAIPPAVLEARIAAAAAARKAAALARSAATTAGQIVQKSRDAVNIEGHDIVRGLLKPDGDHFSVGLGATGEATAGLGAVLTAGLSLDVVVDYPSHEVGLFLSPAAGVGATGGEAARAAVGFAGSWGTVLSFGANRGRGVRAGYQGAFINAGLAAQGDYGAGVSMGSGFYVGAAPLRHAVAPLVAAGSQDPHVPQSQTTPGTPGTPAVPPGPAVAQPEHGLTSGRVFFDTGQATITPAGRAEIDGVLGTIASTASSHPESTFRAVTLGGASLRWRHPDKRGADADNLALSQQRADAVNSLVVSGLAARGLTGRVATSSTGTGSAQAAADARTRHLSSDDNAQIYRDTTVTVYEAERTHTPGTPGTPGTPPTTVTQHPSVGGWTYDPADTPRPAWSGDWGGDDRTGHGFYDPHDPNSPFSPGSDANVLDPMNGPWVPDLLNRPTMGWDTQMGVNLGAQEGASVDASIGASFSFPLGAFAFPGEAVTPLRVTLGLVKVLMDVETLSVAGGLRDVAGIIGAFIPDSVVTGIANLVFPLPPGYTD